MRLVARARAWFLAAALTGLPLAPGDAQDSVDRLAPDTVRAALSGWLVHLLGPAIQLPPDAIAVTRDGDHDRIALRADALSFGLITADQPVVTAAIRPSDATRVDATWSVDDLRAPSPLRLTLHQPRRANPLATLTITTSDQSARALIDPTERSDSTMDGTWHGVDSIIDSPSGQQSQHFDSITSQFRLRPGPDQRADLMQTTDIMGYSGHLVSPDGAESGLTAERLHIAGHLDGLDTTKLAPALQSAIAVAASIAAALPDKQDPADKPDRDVGAAVVQSLDRVALNQLLLSLPGIVGGLQVEESADNVSIRAVEQTASLAHIGLGMSASAPDGLLQTKLDLALDGLAMPTLSLLLADLTPRHIALRPTMSGLNLSAAMAMANQAADDGKTPDAPPPDLFGPNGLVTSIDRFSMDVGPATLTGNGHVTLLSDQSTRGNASITITGYDALMGRIGQSPVLQQAMPIFLLAKGLAHQDGANLVWEINYIDGKTTVNGTDLSAMVPRSPH